MDWTTLIGAVLSSGLITWGAVRWLTAHLVEHRLAKDLQVHQARLDRQLADSKAELDLKLSDAKISLEATFRKEVEDYLGDRVAERQYQLEARKRLYTVIGPLRFQLILSCADFAGRIARIGNGKQPYSTSLSNYFGRSTSYRLLRIIALSELIERQMTHADFSVDPSTADLLRFKHAAFLSLSSSSITLDHPSVDWNQQAQHVFYDSLPLVADAVITSEEGGKGARVMRFNEFNALSEDPSGLARLEPIPSLFENFSPTEKPLLWVRFVALGTLCAKFAQREGPDVSLKQEPFEPLSLLASSKDAHLQANLARYLEAIDALNA